MQNLTTVASAISEIWFVPTKIKWLAWPDHAPFRNSLPSVG